MTSNALAHHIRDLEPADHDWAAAFLEPVGGRLVARRGELIDLLTFPALVVEVDGDRRGILCYRVADDECEIGGFIVEPPGHGLGTALVHALVAIVSDRPIRVTTTNDNVDALRFYQRRGFRLRELRAGAVDRSRATLKPGIPEYGDYGIPIRDEIELELDPRQARPAT